MAVPPGAEGLRSTLDALDEAVFRMRAVRDAAGHIVDFEYDYCNRAALEVLGRPGEEVLGRRLLEMFPSHRTNGLFDAYARVTETGESFRHEFAFNEGGVVGEFEVVVSRTDDGYVLAGHDVTDRNRLRDVLEASHDMISINLAKDSTFVAVSPACQHILGYAPGELIGRRARDLVHPDDREAAAASRTWMLAGQPVVLEYRMVRKDGEPVWVESSARPPAPGRDTITVVTRDVTERHEWQELLMNAALHDPVTGLANRRLFDERLESEVARIERRGTPLAVLFIDLNDFKAVNDRLGHLAGDKVLQQAADRISQHVRAGDVAARYGGDEFVVACVDLQSDAEAHTTAERIRAELARPYNLDDNVESIHASLGIAMWQPGMTPDQLVHSADQAMYAAKPRTIMLPEARSPSDSAQPATARGDRPPSAG